jgi:FkbM family methyltransferase
MVKASYGIEQLDYLMAETMEELTIRETSAREQLRLGHSGRLVLFGAGGLGRVSLAGLRRGGVEPLAFADNNPLAWGTVVDGLPVMSLAGASARFGDQVTFVVTIYTGAEVERKLRGLGLRVLTFPQLALMYPDALLPYYALDLPSRMHGAQTQIREAYSLWADDASRAEYLAQIRFRYTFDSELPPPLAADQTYFPRELVELRTDEVFVDCGAFDGDSVMAFLKRSGGWLGGIVGIEADPCNMEKLKAFISRLSPEIQAKSEAVQVAISSRNGTVLFDSTGSVYSSYQDGRGTVEVPSRKLDDILQDKKPSYIKMDIEGAEPDALAGAHFVIQQHAPVMAICLYHRQSDLWKIPLQVRSITDRYSYFLRRHSDDCWEQVLYAIPHERVRKLPSL